MRGPTNRLAPPSTRWVRALLKWFAREARPLPWRRTTDPYAIWISEVMLQQTQVAIVIPYWERWMRELPTVQALAEASAQKVLKLWEGLGYYRRARHLQAAARQLVEQHQGQFPTTPAGWLELPGVGRYTAGAVLSIAFNQPAPILDGNVQRVLCRFHGFHQNPGTAAAQKQLWALAEAWVQLAAESGQKKPHLFPRACSALNQALMELGAVICTPRQPRCDACPLRGGCFACTHQQTHQLPVRERRAAVIKRITLAAVVEAGNQILVRQRPAEGVNGNLWEFPAYELPAEANEGVDKAAERRRLVQWLRRKLGVTAHDLRAAGTYRHNITCHRYEMRVWRAKALPLPPRDERARWITRTELNRLPMPAVHRRLARGI
ncbi:MAG: A/G-specific adenine glycosylase [Verrucomicrobiae bacterium]|nr:A/G-specific adenine glycosylase [Verrucomicrobiae bacterium]